LIRYIILLILLISFSPLSYSQVAVVTQHNDIGRTGWNSHETILNKNNVNTGSFGLIFKRPVDDQIYAQPLVAYVHILGGGPRNIVFVATVNNSLYAFDADSALINNPYWQINLTPAGSRVIKNRDMTGACGGFYADFTGNMGIVGTPVIDTLSKTIYFVARSINVTTNTFEQYFHAIDIQTGNERSNSPVLIQASVAGTGDGNVNGTVFFDPQKNNQRPALLLLNGIVYIGFSSHCDWGPYHGWLIGYDAATLQQKIVYNDTPDGYNGGIWMSGSGPAADSSGNIFITTGNGSVGSGSDPSDLINRSESALKLTPSGSTLTVSSFFTPSNYNELEASDLDFGAGSAILIPGQNRMIAGCKDGNLYLMDGNNLGGYNSAQNQSLQNIYLGNNANMHAQFCYYGGAAEGYLYAWSENTALKSVPFNRLTGLFDSGGIITSGLQGPVGQTGAMLSISSNGSEDSTAILWASHPVNCDAEHESCPGILRALDAGDINRELWNSTIITGDNPGNFAKFNSPAIANGKVYLGTFSNQLMVYGLKSNLPDTCNSVNLALNKPAFASSILNDTLSASQAFDGDFKTYWSSQYNDLQSIYVDLGKIYDLCSINLFWGTSPGKDFQIQVSYDTINWQTLVNMHNNQSQESLYNIQGTGRYVRMLGTLQNNSTGYSLIEFQVFGRESLIKCPPPFGLNAINIYENSATLRWSAYEGASFNVAYKSVKDTDWIIKGSLTNSIQVNGLSCGTDYYFKIQSGCPDSSSSAFSPAAAFSTLACNSNCGFLPSHWSSQDIGNPGIPGSACFFNGVFTMNASGSDIWDISDQFHFAYSLLQGDGSVIIRVVEMDQGNPWNKCGIMIRGSLASGSKHAFIALTSGNGVAFQYRDKDYQVSNNYNITGINYPVWLRLVKQGSTYSGFYSVDSINWKPVGDPVDAGFGDMPVYIGIALTSHDNNIISSANLDQFKTTGFTDIDLLGFTGEITQHQTVELNWSTSLEINAAYFLIERGMDGVNYNVIDTVWATNHGKFIQNYTVVDPDPQMGINYYRLKIIDLLDNFTYSPLVIIRLTTSISPLVFPNPVHDDLYISQGSDPITVVSIYDKLGRMLNRFSNDNSENTLSISMAGMVRTMYIVEIRTKNSSYRYRLIKH
jgi:hypothetical protein